MYTNYAGRKIPDKVFNMRCSRDEDIITNLARSEDDPVVVLLAVLLVLIQLLPPQTHRHWAEVFIHAKVVPVF